MFEEVLKIERKRKRGVWNKFGHTKRVGK